MSGLSKMDKSHRGKKLGDMKRNKTSPLDGYSGLNGVPQNDAANSYCDNDLI